jgi:hypothetical protein
VTVSGSLRSATPIAAVALLAACAQAPPAPDAPAPRVFTKLVDTPREDAVRRHREYAAASRAANDPATALDHLQVAAMLEPDNAAVPRGHRVRAGTDPHTGSASTSKPAVQRSGRTTSPAHRRSSCGCSPVDPRNAEAARALRDIDRQNMARAQAGRAARVRVEDLFAEARAAWAAPAPAAGERSARRRCAPLGDGGARRCGRGPARRLRPRHADRDDARRRYDERAARAQGVGRRASERPRGAPADRRRPSPSARRTPKAAASARRR